MQDAWICCCVAEVYARDLKSWHFLISKVNFFPPFATFEHRRRVALADASPVPSLDCQHTCDDVDRFGRFARARSGQKRPAAPKNGQKRPAAFPGARSARTPPRGRGTARWPFSLPKSTHACPSQGNLLNGQNWLSRGAGFEPHENSDIGRGRVCSRGAPRAAPPVAPLPRPSLGI